MNKEVEEFLLSNQDIKYRDFQKKLGLGNQNIIGVRIPLVRKYAKSLLKNNKYIDYINNPSNNYFEETLLEGFLIAGSKLSLNDKFNYLDKYIYKIDNWATCDTFCSSFNLKDDELDKMFNYLLKYKKSKDEFVLRFCVVMMLDHYLIDEYIDRVLLFIKDIYNGKYYIDMAIGWLLSFVYIKYREKFDYFIKNSDLSLDIRKITYRKILDSKKVSSSDKEILKTNCLFI